MSSPPASKSLMPRGIPYIIGNEAAERFSFYGMKTILMVFMTDHLLMSENRAITWQNTFQMAAYLLPLLGGLVADIFWGKYKTIIRLSLFYCFGHAVLAMYETKEALIIGLGLIAIGAGGIKSCVSAHVGDQFNRDNSNLLERVFGYFYISINVGATISQLLTPWLMEHYGPSIAFGIPGILMFIATVVFWFGRKKFIAIPPVDWKTYRREVLSWSGIKIILRLCIIYFFIAIFWALYDQTGTTWVLQAKRELLDKTINLGFVKFDVLPAQIQSINPFLIVIFVPLFSFFVYPLINRFFKLNYLRKISIGLFITAFSFVIIALIENRIEQGIPTHVGWQLAAFFIITAAEVFVSITALEFSYTQAPVAMKSFIMGVFWFAVTAGNFITNQVNNFIVHETQIEQIATGARTYATMTDMKGIEEGLKIEADEITGVQMLQLNKKAGMDTMKLSGTFVIGSVNSESKTFEVLDINKKPVQSIMRQASFPQTILVNELKGSDYYWFFVYLMLGAAVLFVFVAMGYKEKRYIQDDRPLASSSAVS